jgi:RimJ/RimL family protein N-acetyltransferase
MYELRQLQAGDAVEYRDIRLEALETCPESFASSRAEDQGLPVARYEAALSSNWIYGGFRHGRLAGVIAVSRPNFIKLQHKAIIGGIFIRESARGAGLSDGLVKMVLRLSNDGVECIHARVATHKEPIITLYRRNGFDVYGTESHSLRFEDGRYLDEYLMICKVGR